MHLKFLLNMLLKKKKKALDVALQQVLAASHSRPWFWLPNRWMACPMPSPRVRVSRSIRTAGANTVSGLNSEHSGQVRFDCERPNRVGTPEKAEGCHPIAFALSSSTASCKAMTSTDKPSRSAAELHGERDYHSVIAPT